MKISLLIPCAGSGKRMNANQNKMLMNLQGQTVLQRTLSAFDGIDEIIEIILITREEDRADVLGILEHSKIHQHVKLVLGGKERQDSVQKGLDAVASEATHVMVHDGARPFVTKETLQHNIKALSSEDAICTGVPTKDTLKIVDSDRCVLETPDRSKYWNIQTPQSFEKKLLNRAYAYAASKGYLGTDDASLVEFMGAQVLMVMGSYDNIKVTTMEDLAFGKAILEFRKQQMKEAEVTS